MPAKARGKSAVTAKASRSEEARQPKSDSRFFNRELSLLDYGARILALAEDDARPALDRAKFLAIFSTSLDEFFQIRVSGLREQMIAGVPGTSPDGMSPREQLDTIRGRVQGLVARMMQTFEREVPSASPRGRHPDHRLERPEEDPARAAASGLRGAGVPGVDAACGRPGPSVSLHLRPVPEPGGGRSGPGDRNRRFARVKAPPLLPRFLRSRAAGGSSRSSR